MDGLVNNFELLKFKKEGNIDKYIKKKNITYIAQFFNEDEMNHPIPYRRAYEEIMEFNKAKRFWNDYNLTVYETGHYSIFIKIKEIRKLIVDKTFN